MSLPAGVKGPSESEWLDMDEDGDGDEEEGVVEGGSEAEAERGGGQTKWS